jgi:SAM-dependent methyltransferase
MSCNVETPTIVQAAVYSNSGNIPLLRMISRLKPDRLLDCGCGAGDNARIFQRAGWDVTGVTINPEEQRMASEYGRVHLANLEQGLPPDIDGTYQVILLSHILEHLVWPDRLLCSLRRVCASSTVLAVALPNIVSYPQRLSFLSGRFEYTSQGIMDRTHVHFYTYGSGARLLENNGYRVIDRRVDGVFPLWKLRLILPRWCTSSINALACSAAPGLFGFQCLYLASPE